MEFDLSPDHEFTYEDVKTKLKAKFPNLEYNLHGKHYLVCKKSGSIGTIVVIKKERMMISGNFPSKGGQMFFLFCVILLGFVIPIIIYLVAFRPKMKALEKEVGAYLKEEYATP